MLPKAVLEKVETSCQRQLLVLKYPTMGVLMRMKIAAILLMSLVSTVGFAQSNPGGKPISIVLPYTPGGGTDLLARANAPGLRDLLGNTVIVENKPGAAGFIAMRYVAAAPGDGLTLLLASSAQFAVNPHVYKDQPQPLKDLKPVAMIGEVDYIIAINSEVPARTIQELTALAKAKPGTLSFASAGTGGAVHLAGELYKSMANVNILHVPYSGTGPALNDVLGNHVQFTFAGVGLLAPHINSGRLRGIASTGAERSPSTLNLPTLAESGLPGYRAGVWYALYAPATTPDALVRRYNEAVRKVLVDPKVKELWTKSGYSAPLWDVAEFAAFQKSEYDRWGAIVRNLNLSIELK